MEKERHGGKQAADDDVYERKDAAREPQLEARIAQRFYAQFEALMKQLAAQTVDFGVPRHQPPDAHHMNEEDGDDVEGEEHENSFAVRGPRMGQFIMSQNISRG